jgi:ABC-type polysaccharide/polyol phosphate export permease
VSSAFVRVQSMPDWLEWFAARQPMTLVTDAVRDLTLGINVSDAELSSVAWSIGILLVAFPLGLWLYDRRTTQ